MNRQKSRSIVENVLSGTKAGFKAILNFKIERKKMDNQWSISKFSATLLTLTLMVAAFWVSPAAAQKYVTDPSTGKVLTAPEYGGTLTQAGATFAAHADPFYGTGVHFFLAGVNETLAIADWGLDREEFDFRTWYRPLFSMGGLLAESWETPDPLTYIFNIRKGVHWHNKPPVNGREMTAKDVEFSLLRITGMSEEGPPVTTYEISLMPIESITATDQWTVVIKLERARPDALRAILISANAYILPPEVIRQHGDMKDWRNVVGTGPFMLTDYVEGSSFTWDKNADYWGYDEKYPENRLPYVDQVRALHMVDEATRLAALRSGKIDLLLVTGGGVISKLDTIKSLQRTNPEIQVEPFFGSNSNAPTMNRRNPPLDDIRVRQAMQMALDLETINEAYLGGFARWEPMGLIGDVKGFYVPFEEWPEELKKTYRYDPEGAEALLDAAGYPRGADGVRFKVTYCHRDSMDLGYVEITAGYWDAIGVDVEIDIVDVATMISRLSDKTYEMCTGTLAVTSVDHLMSWYNTPFREDSMGGNPGADPELDAAYEGYIAASTVEEQQKFAKELDMYLIRNHFSIWGPQSPAFNVARAWVKGWNGEILIMGGTSGSLIARLWIDQELKDRTQ